MRRAAYAALLFLFGQLGFDVKTTCLKFREQHVTYGSHTRLTYQKELHGNKEDNS